MVAVLRRAPMAWLLGAFYFLTFGGFVAFSIYLPTLLRAQFGLAPADAGFRAAGFVVLATLMRPVGGWLADRIGGAQVLSWVFGGVALFSLLLTWPSMVPFTVGALGVRDADGARQRRGVQAGARALPEGHRHRHRPRRRTRRTGRVLSAAPARCLPAIGSASIWPGFLLLSATALAAARGQPALLPSGATSHWMQSRCRWPRGRRSSASEPARGQHCVTLTLAGGDRRRLAASCSTSTRRWSATRSRRSSRHSASAIATRCGCSVRRRACTGGADGRRSSRAGPWPATPSALGRRALRRSSPPTASSSGAAACAAWRTG